MRLENFGTEYLKTQNASFILTRLGYLSLDLAAQIHCIGWITVTVYGSLAHGGFP